MLKQMIKTSTFLLSVLLFIVTILYTIGCGKGKQSETMGSADSSRPTVEAEPQTTPKQPEKKFVVVATATDVHQSTGTITIDHEKMEGYMEAMEMPFKVGNPEVFKQVKVGAKGHFTIEVTDNIGVISAVTYP